MYEFGNYLVLLKSDSFATSHIFETQNTNSEMSDCIHCIQSAEVSRCCVCSKFVVVVVVFAKWILADIPGIDH